MENQTKGYIIDVRYRLEACQYRLRSGECDYKSGRDMAKDIR